MLSHLHFRKDADVLHSSPRYLQWLSQEQRKGRKFVKVVYVVLESQYQSARIPGDAAAVAVCFKRLFPGNQGMAMDIPTLIDDIFHSNLHILGVCPFPRFITRGQLCVCLDGPWGKYELLGERSAGDDHSHPTDQQDPWPRLHGVRGIFAGGRAELEEILNRKV